MFTFILFLIMCTACFGIYVFFSNKIALLRKQNMILANQNTELRIKLKDLLKAQSINKSKPSSETSILNIIETKYTDVNE
ncbi:hypothetical protein JK636_11665 [Clostridium sp. YIM B02515]|uniref:Uncharacterized protein n=1 Tax=Clostridium rhizosphaerae TaxID=2803861 RepID=A0ABS1TAP5_9CLOT|nr:hypothetical protein [Clostridium rhizosphaerae]MBL4936418.1 hypothetical protein [Clostridium rhizosphaerae]